MSRETQPTPQTFILDFVKDPSELHEYLTVADSEREARLIQAAAEVGGATITAVGGESDLYVTVYKLGRSEWILGDDGTYSVWQHSPSETDPIKTSPARLVGEGNSVLSITPASLAPKVTLRSADLIKRDK